MSKSVQNFLKKYGFLKYQNKALFLPKLNKEIKKHLQLKNNSIIQFPQNLNQSLQSKNEKSYFLLIDLGGTYLRLYLCQSQKNNIKIIKEEKFKFYQKIIYTPEILVSKLYQHIKKFLKATNQNPPKNLILSFANSLKPKISKNQLEGKILYWGKQHQQKNLLGKNLGKLLEKFLSKHNIKVKVQLINDGSLSVLSSKFQSISPTIISLIVGTGTNINLGFIFKNKFHINNLEFGNFQFFPYSIFDEILNKKTTDINNFKTEKLFSGAWQSQLFIIILKFALKENILKDKQLITRLSKLDSGQLEKILNQKSTKTNPERVSQNLKICQEIWLEINKRGAKICTITITEIAKALIELKYLKTHLTIEKSGSILENNGIFSKTFNQQIKKTFHTDNLLSSIKMKLALQNKKSICYGSVKLLELLNLN